MQPILSFQPSLRPVLPEVIAGADYRAERQLFERIDRILAESDLDAVFLRMAVEHQQLDLRKLSSKEKAKFAQWAFIALRCCVARVLSGLALRPFTARLADSHLLQWFLHLTEVDVIKVFAKSTAHRLEQWVSPEQLRELNTRLLKLGIAPPILPPLTASDAAVAEAEAAGLSVGSVLAPEAAPEAEAGCDPMQAPAAEAAATEPSPALPPFGLEEFLDLSQGWLDTTAVLANIHHPTDWVLLRDAARTLMKGVLCIRTAGVFHRMPQGPGAFLSDMNTLCMAMSAQRRQKGAAKARKAILRKMKNLLGAIVGHAESHIKALRARRETHTALTEGQAAAIIGRMEKVLGQVAAIRKQAHDRIIGGRKLEASEKILSIYDDAVNIIVRGKASAEVEFGNRLDLVESRQGLILDAFLHRGNPADSSVVQPCALRLLEAGLPVKRLGGDRGLQSAANEEALEKLGIESFLCPRDPAVLARRLDEEPGFRENLKRRGGTEGRIAIFKNDMLGNPASGRSYEARVRGVGWSVLAHNLWVLARLPQRGKAEEEPKPEEDELAFLGPPPADLEAAA